jgi:hypothetical protein
MVPLAILQIGKFSHKDLILEYSFGKKRKKNEKTGKEKLNGATEKSPVMESQ